MHIRPFASFRVGERAEFAKTVTEADVTLMAGISGDFNALHLDEEFGRRTRFQSRVAHGVLTVSFVSAANTLLTGPGFVYLGQEIKFLAPVRIGDTVTAVSEVAEVRADKRILRVRTTVRNQRGEMVADGIAGLKKLPELE
ncbi:MAG TPA: MaoC family dehydratase [Candidatus Methylomirabilis sp.]|jgi:3-hydroxybutyryl-CoA dehydratase